MLEDTIRVKLSLKNEAGKEIDSVTVNVPPGRYRFRDLPPGKYTIMCTSDVAVRFIENPIKRTLDTKDDISGQLVATEDGLETRIKEPSYPVIEIITLTAISMTLLGNLGLVEDFAAVFSSPETAQPLQRQSLSESRSKNPDDRLSLEVEARLEQCLKENIKNLLGVPSLSGLVESLNNERNNEENPNNKFQAQIRASYKTVQQLRQTIEDCDPTLIQELIATEDSIDEQRQGQFQCEAAIRVMGDIVNVRISPNINSEVIGQILYGTCVQVDTEAFAYFSEKQRLIVAAGEGWYPIVLPDGRRGYVNSRYMSSLP
jgi:Bacterial SH3 domain